MNPFGLGDSPALFDEKMKTFVTGLDKVCANEGAFLMTNSNNNNNNNNNNNIIIIIIIIIVVIFIEEATITLSGFQGGPPTVYESNPKS